MYMGSLALNSIAIRNMVCENRHIRRTVGLLRSRR